MAEKKLTLRYGDGELPSAAMVRALNAVGLAGSGPMLVSIARGLVEVLSEDD